MSEPLVDETTLRLDGELPRLGNGVPPVPVPTETPAVPASAPGLAAPALSAPGLATPPAPGPDPILNAPGSAPILTTPEQPMLPTLPSSNAPVTRPVPTGPALDQPTFDTTNLPNLPASAPKPPTPTETADTDESASATEQPDGDHPMAHLMPGKSAASEASRRAAEIRAAKKAKAKKVKIGVAIGAIVVGAVVGPPLGKWFVNAINEAGSTSTEVTE